MIEKLKEPVYIFTCERCDKEWLQRPKASYEEDELHMRTDKHGKKIVELDLPKNCTLCKSPVWNTPKGL